MTHRWLLLPLAALAYWGSARLGMALFSLQPSNITLLWLPSGIGLVMMVAAGRAALPWIFAASFLANLDGMAQGSWPWQLFHTGVVGAMDVMAPWFAAHQLRRWIPNGIERIHDCWLFILHVCALPTLLTSVGIATNLVLGGYIATSDSLSFVWMLLMADSLGILLIYPLYENWVLRQEPGTGEARYRLAGWAALVGLLLLAHVGQAQWIYLVIPVLLFLAFHGGARHVTLSLLLVIVAIVSGASSPLSPFALSGRAGGHQMLVAFLYSITVSVLWGLYSKRELEHEQDAARRWQHRAGHDPLTGMVNRSVFDPMMAQELERARRGGAGAHFAVAMVDLDHFKAINDQHGHAVGDAVLVDVAQRMKAFLRGADVIARYGGEEFAVLFPHAHAADAVQALERIRLDLEERPVRVGHSSIEATISAGVAEFTPSVQAPQALLQLADQALYQAKRQGRNRIALGLAKA